MEEQLCAKMNEFMMMLDQVKRYRALLSALPDMAIIIGLAIVSAVTASVWNHLSTVFGQGFNGVANSLTTIFIIIGVSIGFFWVYQKMKRAKVGEWKNALKEGGPGAIKLLQNMDWDETYRNIRYAKLGFALYGVLKTVAIWIITLIVSMFVANYLFAAMHWSIGWAVAGLFSLALALTLSTNDFKKRFDQIGKLDALLWELRWFDNEYRRNPFQT